jgi:hypothetical protein
MDEWITTIKAATILKVDPEHVALLCRRGTLQARKFGRDWQVLKSSVEDYKKNPRRKPKRA